MAATDCEPDDVRRIFPSFDEPTYKATFSTQVKHWSSMQALSNGMELRTIPSRQESAEFVYSVKRCLLSNGWSITSFAPSPKMSSYLFAVVVHNFTSLSATTSHGTLVNIYFYVYHIAHSSSHYTFDLFDVDSGVDEVLVDKKRSVCIEWCSSCLTILRKYIWNTVYPSKIGYFIPKGFEKTIQSVCFISSPDLVALPQFLAGAMENWGIVTFRESAMLVDPMAGPRDPRVHRVSREVAHELAHMVIVTTY